MVRSLAKLVSVALVWGMSLLITTSAEEVGTVADYDADVNWQEARQFWSFQSPERHPAPDVQQADWPRQPVDYFVLNRMEAAGLSPNPQAERRALIRRLSFDLTGLPPAPEAVEAFVYDSRPNAYELLVDDLLASPAFGERMASLWMTVARYAEDQAHQVGNDRKYFYPNAYLYREWVVNAFNEDLPYDQFIRLQLAADMIEGDKSPNLPALGFIGLGPKYYARGRLDVKADEWEDRVDTVSRSFLGLTVACARCHTHKFDPITMADYYALAGVFASIDMENKPLDEQRAEMFKNEKDASKKPEYTMHVVKDEKPENLNIFIRGDVERKGPVVERGFLKVLSEGEREHFEHGSGRGELAEAIADPTNPLTARVMVNRMWALLFGKGLVGTLSNFGSLGETPSHPELLDDLAVRFTEGGWSTKALIRELVLSATYRQSSEADELAQRVDGDNRFLSHMKRRRLSVEQWRDAVLFVSGTLSQEGGPSLELNDPKNTRRTLYGRISRKELNPFLTQFDYPDANVHVAKRAVTTTPTQKLFAMNSEFIIGQAEALAAKLDQGALESRINEAYLSLFAREAKPAEIKLAVKFLDGPKNESLSRWAQYTQVLLASNEFLYLD